MRHHRGPTPLVHSTVYSVARGAPLGYREGMTDKPLWGAVDDWIARELQLSDPVLDSALADSEKAGLPPIAVTAAQGRFLQLLVLVSGARRILEIGTLGGFSTIYMARALPDGGRLTSLEISELNASVARANIERAGLAGRVEIRVAPAVESLKALERQGEQFDLVFVDADKKSNKTYLDAAVRMSHRGTVIVVDNVVRDGAVVDDANRSDDIEGIRAMMTALGGMRNLTSTALQTVGGKGYDGFVIARVE